MVGLAFDVVNEIKAAGILARYASPESKAYADMFKDAEGYFMPTHLIHAVIGYNSKLVSPREAPKDYPDLLGPTWKGALTIDTEPSRALMGWLKAWGEERTRKYLEGLTRNGVTVTRGHTLQTQLLCAGEYKAAIELYLYTAAQMQRTGCPIHIVYPNPTTVASAQSWAIPVVAPRPHAAALLLDFLLSAEAANLVADNGRIPARSGVKPKFEVLNQLASGAVPVQVLTSEDAQHLRAYRGQTIQRDSVAPMTFSDFVVRSDNFMPAKVGLNGLFSAPRPSRTATCLFSCCGFLAVILFGIFARRQHRRCRQ